MRPDSPIPGTRSRPPSIRVLLSLALLVTLLAAVFVRSSGDSSSSGPYIWVNFFWYWIAVYEFDAAILLAAILLAMLVCPKVERIEAIAVLFGRSPWIPAAFIAALLGALTLLVYRNHPLCMDEYVDWFQSRVFAAGKIAGQWPPELIDWLLPKGFQGNFLRVSNTSGEVMSGYFPGYALVQAPFVLLGVPWLCNPVLTGATLLVMAYIAKTLFGTSTAAGWVLLFAVASPVFLIYGISYYSSTGQLLLNLGFCALLLRPSQNRLFWAGIVGGLATFYHNPIRHVFFALPWVLWIFWTYKPRLKGIGLLAFGYLPSVLLLGGVWLYSRGLITSNVLTPSGGGTVVESAAGVTSSVTGLAMHAWQMLSWPSENSASARLAGLVKTWLWTTPLIPMLAVLGCVRCKDVRVRLLFWSAFATFAAYVFMMPLDQGHGWGDRYFHSVWGVLPILAYAWIASFQQEHPERVRVLLATIGAGAVASFLLAFPLRLWQVDEHMRKHLSQMPHGAKAEGREIVLLNLVNGGYYMVDLVQNDPWLRGGRVVLLSQGPEKDAEMLRRNFPDCKMIKDPPWGSSCVIE